MLLCIKELLFYYYFITWLIDNSLQENSKQTLQTLTKEVSYPKTQKRVQGNVPAPAAHHWYEGPANDPGETVEDLLHHVVVQRLPGEVLLHR